MSDAFTFLEILRGVDPVDPREPLESVAEIRKLYDWHRHPVDRSHLRAAIRLERDFERWKGADGICEPVGRLPRCERRWMLRRMLVTLHQTAEADEARILGIPLEDR